MRSINIQVSFSQKLIFKARSKSNKNCVKDTAKNKKKKAKTDKDVDPKILDDREKAEKGGDKGVNARGIESARQSETSEEREVRCAKEIKIDGGVEISIETIEENHGGPETKDKEAENATEGEKATLDEERSKENGEPLQNKEVQEVAEAVATVKTESQTKEKEDKGEAEGVMENGIETDGEKDDSEIKHHHEEAAEEIVADSLATAGEIDE